MDWISKPKNKTIIILIAAAVVGVVAIAGLTLAPSSDGTQTQTGKNTQNAPATESVADTATAPEPLVTSAKEENEPEESVQNQDENRENTQTSGPSGQSSQTTPAPVEPAEPSQPASPEGEQPEEEPTEFVTGSASAHHEEGQNPDSDPTFSQSTQSAPVRVRNISLHRGPCTVMSTYRHPYDGWPMLHFSHLQATVSQSSNGRSLGTLLTQAHSVRYAHLNQGQVVGLTANQYCNNSIRHRHLVAVAQDSTVDCATLTPPAFTGVPFEPVVLGASGWCTRDIPRSSWGQ